MAKRMRKLPVILKVLCSQKGDVWNASTRKVVETDAQRVLESMVAEFGIEGAEQALRNQGFQAPPFRYLLKPLHAEACRRRSGARGDLKE